MNIIKDTIEYIRQLLTWWVDVMPWEQGVRVTLGKTQILLNKGIWIKIPIIHNVYVVQVRLRVMDTPVQTVSTLDDITISIRMAIGYQVVDVVKFFGSLNDPTMTIANTAQSKASEIISNSSSSKLKQEMIQDGVLKELRAMDCGIRFELVGITNFAKTKPYRLMGDAYWANSDSDTTNNHKR